MSSAHTTQNTHSRLVESSKYSHTRSLTHSHSVIHTINHSLVQSHPIIHILLALHVRTLTIVTLRLLHVAIPIMTSCRRISTHVWFISPLATGRLPPLTGRSLNPLLSLHLPWQAWGALVTPPLFSPRRITGTMCL